VKIDEARGGIEDGAPKPDAARSRGLAAIAKEAPAVIQ